MQPQPYSKIFALTLILAVASTGCAAGTDAPGTDASEASAIVELLALGPGQCVADVGAGDGEWSEALARKVGADGHVWATEVKEDLVEDLQNRMEKEGLPQIEAVLGDQESLGLPPDCCDAVLLRLVYHHFQDPAPMRRELLSALKTGGKLLIIDIEPQEHWGKLDGVPERGGHGIPIDELVTDLSAAGFRELERQTPWIDDDERYAVLFAAP